MYDKHCAINGCHTDRCVLYAFRCAVYFASQDIHEPDKLKCGIGKIEMGTIETTMTIADKVVPNLVGVDIGCGITVDVIDTIRPIYNFKAAE